jgi:uncharacterized SAM-binding protein YcdF (DUF218 family)
MVNPNAAKNSRWFIYLSVRLLLTLTVVIAARSACRWLVREDTLSSADVIVVLSGSMPFRAEAAAKLFQMGKAPEVWVSRPPNPAAALQEFGIRFVGEEEYNREILIYQGVPESSVHLVPDPIVNTEQKVNEITREMQRLGKTKVIIVTSPQHTRRVRTLWKELAGRQNQAIVTRRLRRPVRRRPLVAQHTRHVFRSPGTVGLSKRMDRTSRAAQLTMTASG